MLSCAPVLLPFAASRVSWAAGRACGPTQSDEAACQHLGEGGLGSPFLVPSPVSSRTYRICCTTFFCPVRIASYHVCLRGEKPPILPYGPACKCCQGDGVMTATARLRNHSIGTATTPQLRYRRHHYHQHHRYHHQQPTPFLPPGNPAELGGGQGVLECGQIRFVPQKVSTSRRFLVVASVTCHLMPNATMSTWEVPVACFLSAPVRTQRSTRSRSWVLHPYRAVD